MKIYKGLCWAANCAWKWGLRTSSPPEPQVRTIFVSNGVFVPGAPTLIAGDYGSAGGSKEIVATFLQDNFEGDAGVSFDGNNYYIWITLPQGDPAPTGWTFVGGDNPIEFTDAGFYEVGLSLCYKAEFSVADADAWFLYRITAAVGILEFNPALAYSDAGIVAQFEEYTRTLFGANATGAITVIGNNIKATVSGIIFPATSITSTPDFGSFQTDNFNICP